MIHEGIDTQLAQPNPAVTFALRSITIDRSVPTITLVNRNLERLRGFDVFTCAPTILSNQTNACLIVGDNESGYGGEEDQCLCVSACSGNLRGDWI